jgi:hypothetical protein
VQSFLKKVPIQLSGRITVLLAMTAFSTRLGWFLTHSIESAFRIKDEGKKLAFLCHFADQIDAKLNASRDIREVQNG